MKISDFRKLSNAVAKVAHAVSICFDKVGMEKVSVLYDAGYCADLSFSYEYKDIEVHIFVQVHSGDVEETIKKFYDELLSQIAKNITKLNMLEKNEQKNWLETKTYNSNNDLLQAMSALTMFRDIIAQFKN